MQIIIMMVPALLALGNPVPELPGNAKAVLDSAFPHWSLRTGISEYETIDTEFPAAACQQCFINSDTVPDYALHILVGKDSAAIEYIVVLLSESTSYRSITLLSRAKRGQEFGAYYFVLYKAGYQFWLAPFEDQGDLRRSFPTDCVGILMREKNYCDIFLFEKSNFKSFSPCD